MFLQKFTHSCIKEYQFFDDISDVYLHIDLITCLNIVLNFGPVGVHVDPVEKWFQVCGYKVKDIEGRWRNFLFVVVNHDFFGQAELVSFLCVWAHEEDQANQSANKPSNIGQKLVKFIETSSVLDTNSWFFENNFDIGLRAIFEIIRDWRFSRNMNHFLFSIVYIGK